MATSEVERGPWATELVDVVRAASGGMLIGLPLLYTMEVWWIGSSTDPERMLGVLALTFVVVFVLNRTSGFRSSQDVRLVDALADTVEALAIAVVCVAALLVLLREITPDTPMREMLGKIAYESTPFGIGIGLARHFLRRGRTEADDGESSRVNATLADVGATMIGSVFVAFNIAPTDEVPMLSAAMPPGWLLGVVVASLGISYCIVFEAGFSNEEQRRGDSGLFQRPVTETVFCYLLSLVSSALMLWYFQRVDSEMPWQTILSYTVVLGLPAAVGGAAGRLAV
jgi:putative integral membrane protein (TIGR02587 family)